MTPKEEAQDLHLKFMRVVPTTAGTKVQIVRARECALLCARRERFMLLNLASRVIFGTAAAKVLEYQIEHNQLLTKELEKL